MIKACFVFFILTGLALAQDDVVFRSTVSLVRVDAEAIDNTGHFVTGLTKDDFQVLDEGRPQTLVSLSFEEEPLDLILLFDTGGSMRGKLLSMIRATELGFHELRKGDRVCVRVFGSGNAEVLPFNGSLETVNQAILLQVLALKFNGASKVSPAADDAALRFRNESRTHRKRAVLIITDKAADKPAARSANEDTVVRDLWNADAVLSELVIGGAPQPPLPAIVDKTGGTILVAGDPGASFRDSVHYLRSGYTMYYALPDAAPGTERSLRVQLTPEAAKRLPDVRIRARSGYIVSAP